MNKIRLAVIGTGMAWERLHWPALKELTDYYEIVALCNRTRGDADAFAQGIGLPLEHVYTDYQDMLRRSDIDAVDVLVPIPENYEAAAAVLKAGKNLIAEKPLAATLEGGQALLALHRQYPVLAMVAENYRYNEENNLIRGLITQGTIGEILYFINNNVVDFKSEMKKDGFAAKEWRQYPDYAGGTFLDAALHDIAALRHLFGGAAQVYAMGRLQQEAYSPYRVISVQMAFQSGVIGQFNYICDGKETQEPPVGFRIFGSQGEIYLADKTKGRIEISYRDKPSETRTFTPKRGYYNELMNFYKSFHGQETLSVTPEIAYGDMKMVFDILKSIETGQPIPVD